VRLPLAAVRELARIAPDGLLNCMRLRQPFTDADQHQARLMPQRLHRPRSRIVGRPISSLAKRFVVARGSCALM